MSIHELTNEYRNNIGTTVTVLIIKILNTNMMTKSKLPAIHFGARSDEQTPHKEMCRKITLLGIHSN